VLSPLNILKPLVPFLTAKRWLIAYSGGVDSRVLLELLVALKQQRATAGETTPELLLVHVNHQIDTESAAWAEHCRRQGEILGVSVSVHCVDINAAVTGNLEERARQARYGVFESLLQADDVLMLGHHRDDQIETLLMRLLRGSGSRGIGAMPQTRWLGAGQLHRPLLSISRSDIEGYAVKAGLDWIEDPSNQKSDYDRNFLRLQILPSIEQRWPEYRTTLSRAATLSEESAALNAELAVVDCHALGLLPDSQSLSIHALQQLSLGRQKNIIRYWLEQRQLALPSAAQLHIVLEEVMTASEDAKPLVQWSDGQSSAVQVRRFKDDLYAMEALAAFDSTQVVKWSLKDHLTIAGIGEFCANMTSGTGIKKSLVDSVGGVTVQFRQGGERCQPTGRSHSQSLKKLFQEYQVEPWKRDRTPLIYVNDILIAVVGYWICEGYVAEHEPGINITQMSGN